MLDSVYSYSSTRQLAAPAEGKREQRAAAEGDATSSAAENRSTTAPAKQPEGDSKTAIGGKRELTEDERREVEELKRIDREVRQHEAAHQAAAGGLARGKSFTFKAGPDGGQYAVGGEVQIDTSAVSGDPQATITKMQRIKAAASAPADPSSQDRSVAAQASRTEAQARAELAKPDETEEEQSVDTAPADAPQQSGAQTDKPQADKSQAGNKPEPSSPFNPSPERRGLFINAYA